MSLHLFQGPSAKDSLVAVEDFGQTLWPLASVIHVDHVG